ncbi:MAG: hypothetical protein K2X66_06085, partial [Cyanobacteria bacterium]|nr:hypothetical protein [Cyanobacteriota bacterium]
MMMNTVNSPIPFKKQPLFMGLAPTRINQTPSFPTPSLSNGNQSTESKPYASLPGGAFSQSLWSLNPSLLFEGARKKSVNAVEAAKEPLLAEDVVLNKVKYPVYMSPKVDGNRGMVQDGKILGRGLVPIPNPFVQGLLGNPLLEGFDGELISGKPNEKVGLLDQTNSLLRQQKRTEGPLGFYVFDIMNEPDKTYAERLALLKQRIQKLPAALKKYVKLMPQELVYSEADVKKKEAKFLADGYEGAILRSPDAKYKNKRATMG